MLHDSYLPHGACWLWDRGLIAIHATSDLGAALCFLIIPLVALYIYRRGRLARLVAAYPLLWRRGAAFVLFAGLGYLGAFLEIWIGGWLYYVTGANKILMLASSALFAVEFWRRREDLVMVGLVLDDVERRRARGRA